MPGGCGRAGCRRPRSWALCAALSGRVGADFKRRLGDHGYTASRKNPKAKSARMTRAMRVSSIMRHPFIRARRSRRYSRLQTMCSNGHAFNEANSCFSPREKPQRECRVFR
jgi:hypothetical protein